MGFSISIRQRVAVIAIMMAALLNTMPSRVSAQDTDLQASEPVVVMTLGSVNKLADDVTYMSSVVGAPAGGLFAAMARGFTVGIDPERPIGIIVPLVNQTPQPIALIPTDDVKAVLNGPLQAQTGPADELSDGTLVIAVGPSTIFIRQVGQWAVLAPQKQLLDLAPEDPETVFKGMGNNFDLAFQIRLKQVPQDLRTMLTGQIRQGFEQAMQAQPNGDADAAREMAESSLAQLEMVMEQTDTVSFGFNIDKDAKNIAFDASFKAIPGSELAAMYGGQKAIPSRFSSVIRDDAAAYYHGATSISPEAVKQTRTTLKTYMTALQNTIAAEDGLSEDQKAELSSMMDRVIDLGLASVEEGKADVGALLLADESDFRFVFGAFVSDGNEAANIAKEIAAKFENQPNAPRFKFDQSTYKGITMHLVEADVPPDQDEANRVFGDTLRVHIGTGDKAVYAAVGNQSAELMKELIDAGESDTSVGDRPVGQLKLSLLPILQFAQSIESNDTISAMIDALARSADPGNIAIVNTAIANGGKSKITIGEGLLQAIGAAVTQAQQAQFNQF